MRKTIFASATALILCAAAKDGANAGAAPAAATTKAAPVIAGILKASEFTAPERKSKRGSTSIFPFDSLTEIGMSFGVKERTAASLSSVVSNANRKNQVNKTDGEGNIVYKTKELTGEGGAKTTVPTSDPVKVAAKRFYAVDVDPKQDPQGASVRVVREL